MTKWEPLANAILEAISSGESSLTFPTLEDVRQASSAIRLRRSLMWWRFSFKRIDQENIKIKVLGLFDEVVVSAPEEIQKLAASLPVDKNEQRRQFERKINSPSIVPPPPEPEYLQTLKDVVPAHWPTDLRHDVLADLVLKQLSGEITERTDLKKLVNAIRKSYSSSYELSMDAPLSEDEPSRTLHDIVSHSAPLPKRRGQHKRWRIPIKSRCVVCNEIFYWKRVGGKKGIFCSMKCRMKTFRDDIAKLPSKEKLSGLYLDQRWSASKISRFYGVSDSQTTLKILRCHGIKLRRFTKENWCIELGCTEPAYKRLHSKNGTLWGTRCYQHSKKYYAAKMRQSYRSRHHLALAKQRHGAIECCIEGCSREPRGKYGPCDFHYHLKSAQKNRWRNRKIKGIPAGRWRILDSELLSVDQPNA